MSDINSPGFHFPFLSSSATCTSCCILLCRLDDWSFINNNAVVCTHDRILYLLLHLWKVLGVLSPFEPLYDILRVRKGISSVFFCFFFKKKKPGTFNSSFPSFYDSRRQVASLFSFFYFLISFCYL